MFAFVSSFALPTTFSSSFTKAVSVKPVAVAPASAIVMMAEKSKSVPFLDRPEKLDGSMPGDVGFDPLGFSNRDLAWMREAELKHGRICMLAALGWIVPEFYHLPNQVFAETNPLKAFSTAPPQGLLQILLFIMACEAVSVNKLFTKGDRSSPGNYGFDPLGLGKGEGRKRMELAEIKNGRLAMIAMGGFIHQALLTKQGVIAQMAAKNYFPADGAFPLY